MDRRELFELRRINERIKNKMEQLDELKVLAQGVSSPKANPDVIQTSGTQDRMENIVVRIIDLENEVDELVDRYADKRAKVIRAIYRLPRERHQNILYERYILSMKISEIAIQEKMLERSVKKAHAKALEAFEKLK